MALLLLTTIEKVMQETMATTFLPAIQTHYAVSQLPGSSQDKTLSVVFSLFNLSSRSVDTVSCRQYPAQNDPFPFPRLQYLPALLPPPSPTCTLALNINQSTVEMDGDI